MKSYIIARTHEALQLHYSFVIQIVVFKFLVLLEMPSLRKRRETNETDKLLAIFNNDLSDILSEIEDGNDCFYYSWEDSTNSVDSEIIRSVRKHKVAVLSSDFDTHKATDNCWSEIDTAPCLQMFEDHGGVTIFLSLRPLRCAKSFPIMIKPRWNAKHHLQHWSGPWL